MGYNKALWDKGIRTVGPGKLSKTVTDILNKRSNVKPSQLNVTMYKQYLYAKGIKPQTDPLYQKKLAEKRKTEAIKASRLSRTLQAQEDTRYAKQVQQAQQENIQQQKQAEQQQAVKATSGIDSSKLQASVNAPKTEVEQFEEFAGQLNNQIKEAQQPDPDLVSPYIKEGSQANPKQAQQPDESKVSPYLKQPEKFDFIAGSIGSPSLYKFTEEQPEATYYKGKGVTQGPPKPREKTSLEKWFETSEKVLSKDYGNPLIDFPKGVAKFGLSILSSGINLEQLGGKYLTESLTGRKQGTTPVKVPQTFDQPATEGIFEGAVKSFQTGNLTKFSESSTKGLTASYELAKKQGLTTTAGEMFGFLLPIGKNPLPIKIPSYKAMTESGKVRTIARSLELGYGSKTKPIIEKVRTAELAKIEPVGIGEEFSTPGNLGVRVLTSEKGLKTLEEAKKLLSRDVQAVRAYTELAGLIKTSSEKVPQKIREKVRVLPKDPLTGLTSKQSTVIRTKIIPKFQPIKGSLSETMQLEDDLLKPLEDVSSSLPNQKTATKIQKQLTKAGLEGASIGKIQVADALLSKQSKAVITQAKRSKTTKDIDVDYSGKILSKYTAGRVSSYAAKELQKVAESGQLFKKEGTNVYLYDKGKKEVKLNILTERDAKTGYANKPTKPFNIKLKPNIVKVQTTKKSGKYGKFVSLEENMMNRLEASMTLQGPKTEKFAGQGRPDYLKPGYDDVLRTEKGYTLGPVSYNLKHIAKLVSQDAEQISRNLKKAGFENEADRVKEIKNQLIDLYPEIDFGKIKFEDDFGEAAISSLFSRAASKGANLSKYSASMLGLSASKSPYRSAYSPASKPASSGSASSKIDSFSKSANKLLDSIGSVGDSTGTSKAASFGKSKGLSLGSSKGLSLGPSKGLSSGSPGKSPGSVGSSGSGASIGALGFPSKKAITQTRRPPAGFVFNWKTKDKKRIEEKRKYRKEFIGNVPLTRISGMYKRQEVTYGDKKIKRLIDEDLFSAKKNRKSLFSLKKTKTKLF